MTILSPPCLSASLPSRALFCLFEMIDGWELCWAGPVWVHVSVTAGELSSGGQMKSQLGLTAGMSGHIFSAALDLTVPSFPAFVIHGS